LVRPRLEPLEARAVPALAHAAPLAINGQAGTATLAPTGDLTFTPAAGAPLVLNRVASAFNVDAGNNLWLLESTARLWELPSGSDPAVFNRLGGWVLRDANAGSFSLSDSGVLVEVRPNGDLRRFANGTFDAGLLARGVTRADVDASGNVYALIDGDLMKWSPGQTTPARLNDGTAGAGNEPGNVVSFQVGGDTVAWMLGFRDPSAAKVLVSYTNGTNPSFVTDNNGSGLIAVYAVAADGSVLVADPGAQANTGVTLLADGGFNVDTQGTDLPVNGVAQAGTSFQLSPDGKAVAVLDAGSRNLSAYLISGNALGAEQKVVTDGTAQSFGIANDLSVYEYTPTRTLRHYSPFATNPNLTPTLDGTEVSQWQLGPNGRVALLAGAGSFSVTSQSVANAAQLGFAPNGQLYLLTASGILYRGVGNAARPGVYAFTRLRGSVAAFAVNSTSALVVVQRNGDVLRLASRVRRVVTSMSWGRGGSQALSPRFKVVIGWQRIFTGGNVGAAPGSQQAGIVQGTPLFVFPNGYFYLLVRDQFVQVTASRRQVLAVDQADIDWESNPFTNAGVTQNVPVFNPLLGGGTFFSALNTTARPGGTPFPLSLV
jgi:hypothetical protein